MLWRPAFVIAALLALPALTRAECPKNGIKSAMTARLDATVLRVLEKVLVSEMPTAIPLPSTPYTLLECPEGFDDTVVTPISGNIAVKLNALTISLASGAIEVDGDLDVDAGAVLDMQLCAMPDATCPGALSARGIKIHGRIEPTVNACQPSLPVTVAEVTVDPYAAAIRLDSCGLYSDTVALIYDWFRTTILGIVTGAVESALTEKLPALIEATISEMLQDGVDLYGLHFEAAIESLQVNSDAMIVRFAADTTPSNGVASCLPPGTTLPTELTAAPAPMPKGDSMVAVTLSHPFLQRSVRAAWLSGWLCFDTRGYGLNLGELLEPLAPGASLEATLVVSEPPVVQLSAAAANHIQVSSAALDANITIGVPANPTANVRAKMAATLGGQVFLDDAEQALTVQVTDVGSSDLTMQASEDAALVFSQATLEGVIQNLLLPAFAANIGPLPLTSGLFVVAPLAIRLEDVAVESTFVQANIDLWAIDKTDHVAPHTILATAAPTLSSSRVELHVASLDDRTPTPFMRHTILLDGVAVGPPRSGETLVLTDVPGGVRHITLAAVDVNDNADPDPLEITLLVDDLPPVVTVTESPAGVSTEAQTTIRFDVDDTVSADAALAVRYEVSRIVPGGELDVLLSTGELGSARTLTLADLPEDQIIRVKIFAKDEAGNEGVAAVAFAIDRESTFACSSGARGMTPALAVLLLTLARRRRARR